MENPYGSVKVSDMASGSTNGLGSLLGGVQSMETALGAGVGGLVGSWLGNGFMGNGAWGGRGAYGAVGSPVGVADLAVDANMVGRLTGVEAGIAGIMAGQNSDRIINELESIESQLSVDLSALGSLVSNGDKDTSQILGNLSTALAAGNFTTLSSINGLGRDVASQANQNALITQNSFNAITTTLLQGQNEIGRDAANYANANALALNAMAAENAACCCQLKETVRNDGDATRALINDIRLNELQTQLVDAKGQISNANQTNALIAAMAQNTSTIIQHLTPRPFVV